MKIKSAQMREATPTLLLSHALTFLISFILLLSHPLIALSFAQDFTAHHLGDFGNVTVMEVTGNYDARTPDGAVNTLPRQAIAKEFLKTHPDEYDFLTIFSNFDFKMPEEEVVAFYMGVKNDVQGIGLDLTDNSNLYGSAGRLQGTIDMGNLAKVVVDPLDPRFENTLSTLSHEFLHRWAARVRFKEPDGSLSAALLGKDGSHWSYLLDSGGSVLYGNGWRDNGNGTFTAIAGKKYYSPLDLYLMGMIEKSKVPPMLLIENPGIDPKKLPEVGATITGTARYITIDDIIAAEGERIPNASTSQKNFKIGFIFISSPETFNGSELYGIESVRNGFVTRFSILNDGKGIVQIAATPKEDLPKNPGVTLPPITPRTFPPNIDDGVSWLMGRQQEDGSWKDLLQTVERDTTESVITLKSFAGAQGNYAKGLLWLKETSSANIDYLARKINVLAEAGEGTAALVSELLSMQNGDGGWGSNWNYASNPTDTALALKTLAAAGYSDPAVLSKAIDYLKSKQNPDGGWGNGDGSAVQPTVHVLSAFSRHRGASPLEGKIAAGVAFLLQKQNPDGGFGNSPSTVYDTALTILALRELDVPTDVTNRGLNYLLPLQSNDGSWYGSPYQTALAVQAVLKATIDPDLSIKAADIHFSPTSITALPSQVTIQANIWNNGRTGVLQAKVALYDGLVSDAKKIGEQILAFPASAPVAVTFSATIADGNEHRFYLVVDSGGTVKESNELNNTALKVLTPQPTYDLEVLSSDVSFSANPVDIFQDVKIASKVTNHGTADAFNVQLKYSLIDAGGPVEIAAPTIDIPAGATVQSEATWRTNRSGTNLPIAVTADPFNIFAELSETNNTGTASITVHSLAHPNLTLSHQGITITPTPALENGNAAISALVKNEGFSEASNVVVNVYRGVPGAGGTLLGARTIASLAAGASATVSVAWGPIAESGEKVIYVQVDPDHSIQEIREDDNDAFVTLKVLSLPDLVISTSSTVFTPSAPKEGDQVAIQVTVQNKGEQSVSAVAVRASEGAIFFGDQSIPSIPGNGKGTATFTYDTTGKRGAHSITVAVDPDNAIVERTKTNNEASRTFGVQDANLWLTEPVISPNGDGVKESAQFFFRLNVPQTVKGFVIGEEEKTVRTFTGGPLENTTGGNILWDGLDDRGIVVADGAYQIRIENAGRQILGSLPVVVDTNRSSLTQAVGTPYLLSENLTCGLPDLFNLIWRWFPDESGILFSVTSSLPSAPEYPAGLYSMDPDGGNIVRVIPAEWTQKADPTYDYFIDYDLSPNGERIALILVKYNKARFASELSQLWVMDRDGRNLTLLDSYDLTRQSTPIGSARWSSSNEAIVYTVFNPFYADLWTIRSDGSGKTKIDGPGLFDLSSLAWSPDGGSLIYPFEAFDTAGNHSARLTRSDLSGEKRNLFETNRGSVSSFTQLRDQTIVLAESDDMTDAGRLWRIEGEGAPLLLSDSLAGRPSVGPDGRSFVFAAGGDRIQSVYLSDSAGALSFVNEVSLPNPNAILRIDHFFWSPDSSRVAFIYTGFCSFGDCPNFVLVPSRLGIVNLQTGENGSFNLYPNSFEAGIVQWAPDGRSILAKDETRYYVVDSETGALHPIISDVSVFPELENERSPLGRYLAYYQPVDPASACYGKGSSDLWTISSLLNLTAELQARKTGAAVLLSGIAADLHFEEYRLEYADAKAPHVWNPIKPPSAVPVVKETFTAWVPPYEGTFHVRLTVVDQGGNVAKRTQRVSWGLFSSITNLYKTLDLFSPNGDGVKDVVELHYRILEPVHLEFQVYDEGSRLVRTFSKGHAAPGDDFIAWDGRDESGRVVPDGKFRIKLFDFEFFVEVDRALPDALLAWGPIRIAPGAVGQAASLGVALSGHAVDVKLRNWVVEYGEGQNPQAWYEYKRGEAPLVLKDGQGTPLLNPAQDEKAGEFSGDDLEWVLGKKFRITAEDYAGNKKTAATGFLAEEVIFYKWDRAAFSIQDGSLPGRAGGLHTLGIGETIREPIASMTVQYLQNQIWRDGPAILAPPSGEVEIPWDSASLDPNAGYPVRVKAVDILGAVYFSNTAILGSGFSLEAKCFGEGNIKIYGTNAGEALVSLRLQRKKVGDPNGAWIDFLVYDSARGDTIPTGTFEITLQPGGVRMVGVGVSGKSYSAEVEEYPVCRSSSFKLNVRYEEAPRCGLLSSGKGSLSAELEGGITGRLLSLTYSIQKPGGEELLRQIDLTRESWGGVTVATAAMQEGLYPVRAVLTFSQDGIPTQLFANETLTVDRVLPTGGITFPGMNTKLCPQKQSDSKGDWYAVSVEGAAADNVRVDRYELYYGIGENPAVWLPAMTRKIENGEIVHEQIKGKGAVQGRLGLWDVTDLAGAQGQVFSLQLKVIDLVGNVICYTVTFSIDTLTEIKNLSVDKALFSPNGDGMLEEVAVTYEIGESATVDVKVYKRLFDAAGKEIPNPTPVRTLASGVRPAGGALHVWNGRSDSGAVVPDGLYLIKVFATDSCGNTAERRIGIEVDQTAPVIAIAYPRPGDPIGTIVEVRGTADDLHFKDYLLEMGEGADPATWFPLTAKPLPVRENLLGGWSTAGLQGTWSLRLTAADRAGNVSRMTVALPLGERTGLIRSLEIDPRVFSPNQDGKLDMSAARYQLSDAAHVKIEIIDSNASVKKSHEATMTAAGAFIFVWDGKDNTGAAVPDGLYSVKVTASLASNPSVTQSEAATLFVDTTAPTIEVQHPSESAYIQTDVAVQGTIRDANLLDYLLRYTGGTGGALIDQAGQGRENYLFGVLSDLTEGDYSLHVTAKDLGENLSQKNIPFIVDRTPPRATLDAPKEGEYYGFEKKIVHITGAIVERNLETYKLRYGLGDNPTQWTDLATGNTVPTQPELFAWDVAKERGIPDGRYTLSLYAKDRAGFEIETKVKITLDNTPPEVTLTTPEEGVYIKGAIEIQGTAFDQNLDRYQIEFSEGACAAAFKWAPIKTASAPVRDAALGAWPILPTDGNYCLRLTATDKVGNKAEAKAQIKIDTQPPAATVLSGKVENKTDAALTWAANNDPDLAGYNLYRSGRKVNAALLTETGYLDSNVTEGDSLYIVKGVDLAGWESPPSNEISIKIDLTGPNARIRSPQDGSKVGGLIEIKGTAYSLDDFKQYRISIGQGVSPSAWNLVRTSPLPIPFGPLVEWETLGLSEGAYSIRLEGEDLAGNISVHQISVTVDNTPPAPPLVLSAAPSGADVGLTWRANTESDLAGYLLYRNDQLANVTGIVVGDLKPYLISGTAYLDRTLPDGTFRYYLLAVDQAGNASDLSNLLEASLDTHPPHVALTAPLDQSRFQQTVLVRGETADSDIAFVQFQYKKKLDTAWINLGAPVPQGPYMTFLDPVALGLVYGDYSLRGVATDQGGRTDSAPASIAVTYADLTPPEAPQNFAALTQGAEVTLTWGANSETDLAGYNLYRVLGGTKTKINSSLLTETTFSEADLEDGEYLYEVTAVDFDANEGEASNGAVAKVYAPFLERPYTPTGTALLQVVGTGAASNSTVEIFRDTLSEVILIGTVQADAEGRFTLPDIQLVLGDNFLIAKATDGAGNVSREEVIGVYYNEAPAVPTGLAVSVLGDDVSLTWNPNAEPDLLGYDLYRNGGKVNRPSPLTEGDANASSSLSSNTPSNAVDSNLSTYWAPSPGPTPSHPSVWEFTLPSPELIQRVEIVWGTINNPLGGEILLAGKEYEVQAWSDYDQITLKKVTGNSAKENVIEFQPSYRTDGIRIEIKSATDPSGANRVRLAEVKIYKENPIPSASYDDLQLHDGEYRYTVSAVDTHGFASAPSDPAAAVVGDVVAPAAPSGLAAAASGSYAFLSWSANAETDLAGYNVYKKSPEGWMKINPSAVTGTGYTDGPLLNGIYPYRVTALDASGNESAPSGEASVNIAVALPPAPLHLAAAPLPEGGALTLAWESGGPAAGYRLYRGSFSGGPYASVGEELLNGLSYFDAGLTDGTIYYYVVVSVDAIGNESLFSNEAAGAPADTVPPESPAIFFPTLSGQPVILYDDRTDVIGFAEPGSTVTLFNSALPMGETTASGSDLFETFPLSYSRLGSSLSSDGKRFAYTFNRGVWLKNLETGETILAVQRGDAPALSPDGSRIAYTFRDQNFSDRIGLYDVQSRLALPLTEDPFVTERLPSWSSDGGKIAFWSERAEGRGIWIKEMATGAMNLLPNSHGATRLKLSPDGKKVAYFVFERLYLADLLSGSAVEIDAAADGFSLGWAPSGAEIAFVSDRHGTPDLYAWRLESQIASRLTDSPFSKRDPVWSPDGKRLLFSQFEGNGYATRILPLSAPGQERGLQSGLFSLDTLFWAKSGEVAYINQGVLNRITPSGRFRFDAVKLEAGENLLFAAAQDAGGNLSPPSPEITVVFDPSRFPDLEVAEGDLFIYPLAPVAGERVRLGATVRNKGAAEAENLKVDLYLWDAAGNLELIQTETIASLVPGAEIFIAAPWESGGKAGTNSLMVVVDPQDEISEAFEANNFATRDFIVTATEGVFMTATLDSDRYSSSEEVHITVQVVNSGSAREVAGEIQIEDLDGVTVARLDPFQTALPYGASRRYDFVWNTGATFAGSYQVHVTLRNPPQLLAENKTPFEILPDIKIDSTVATDKAGYQAGEEVGVRMNVRNNGRNAALSPVKVAARVVDSAGNVRLSTDQMIGTLLPGAAAELRAAWNSGLSAPGDYHAVADVYLGDQRVESRSVLFKIHPSLALSGTIAATPPVVFFDQAVAADYVVRNDGNAEGGAALLRLLVIDPDRNTVVKSLEQTVSLGIASSHTGRFTVPTGDLSLKRYTLNLQYVDQGIARSLATASFSVEDGAPPEIVIRSPLPEALITSTVKIEAIVIDSLSGIERVEVQLGDRALTPVPVADLSRGRYTIAWTPTPAEAGARTIRIEATDRAGNRSAASVSVRVGFAPQSDAGPDQTVNEGALVTLDGSLSRGAEGQALRYRWEQVAGPAVSLDRTDPVHPTFTAPAVQAGGATLTFGLVVEENGLAGAQDVVNVTVKNVNHPPVAEAGEDQTVKEGAPLSLDGSASFDPDGEEIVYAWVQTAGPLVALSDPAAARPSFLAPFVGGANVVLRFDLTVGDGLAQASDAVQVVVEAANHPPAADAGADQTKDEGATVTLDGAASADPDGDPLTYLWTQSAGTPVPLSDPRSPAPSFTAPPADAGGETLIFKLVVNDGLADSTPDSVAVTVLDRNDPPVCGEASPSVFRLWPPNHKLVEVRIFSVTDPEHDPVTLKVTGVTQDEPVNGTGDGDTSPDAVIQGGTVLIRSERSGGGNGRVYRISFMATDSEGGGCTGSVTVGVPHSNKGTAADDGLVFDSTRP